MRGGLVSRVIDGDAAMASIERPVVVTQGTEDVLVLESTAAPIKQQIARATVFRCQDVGRAPFSEAAERFNNDLAEFARSNAGA